MSRSVKWEKSRKWCSIMSSAIECIIATKKNSVISIILLARREKYQIRMLS